MSHFDVKSARRAEPDAAMADIAEYAHSAAIASPLAYDTARYCLMDALACGLQALAYPDCTRLLGPVVPGATMAGGARVPGTSYELDPVRAAFNIGTMIRWLDFNDTWLAVERGHPADNLGSILAVADYLSRKAVAEGCAPLVVRDLLTAMIKAHEIQGVTALEDGSSRVGLEHVILVRVASTAVITAMLGGTREQVVNAVSNAWIDGGPLRTCRHAPNARSRKIWAAGDANSRAVWHALNALRGEMRYPSALSAADKPFAYSQRFGSYVMENVLFKIGFPTGSHAQTAVECAIQLHPQVKDRVGAVEKIVIETQEPGVRIIDKTGPLDNPADRDHCIQYMTAIPLILGRLVGEDYEDGVANDPRVDWLRNRMEVRENLQFTADYYAPDKRYIGNAVQVFFSDGSSTRRVQVDVPIGHRQRRTEGIPLLLRKFEESIAAVFPKARCAAIRSAFEDSRKTDGMPVSEFVALFVRN